MIRVVRNLAALLLIAAIEGCSPPLVWGSGQVVKDRLFKIVPPGSSPEALEEAAKKRGWTISARDERPFAAGTPTYFQNENRRCAYAGGPSRVLIIAHYWSPLETYVDSYWLFDPQQDFATFASGAASTPSDVGARQLRSLLTP